MTFVVKAEISDEGARTLTFARQKTMYGGKLIAAGDTIFLFASENAGGRGLVARGVVIEASTVECAPGVSRQTPRVSLMVELTAVARCPLGRSELKPFVAWDDGQPATELNFKLYRQATDKIVGVTAAVAAFLETFF